jgi:para-nitrobenzyl esterase
VVKLNPLQEKLSDEMVGYFANVGRLSAGLGEWTRYDAQRDNVMTFSLPTGRMVEEKYADFHHCVFWDRTGVYCATWGLAPGSWEGLGGCEWRLRYSA